MNTAENEFLTWDGGFVAEESEFVVLDPGVCKFIRSVIRTIVAIIIFVMIYF